MFNMALARPGNTANPVRAGLSDLSAGMGIFCSAALAYPAGLAKLYAA
jgi:hypothetical protein